MAASLRRFGKAIDAGSVGAYIFLHFKTGNRMKANAWSVSAVVVLLGLSTYHIASGQPEQQKRKAATTPRKEPAAAVVSNATAVGEFPVIMYLEKRGQTITVMAGPKGPLYSVKNAEGKTLWENLSAEQLRAKAPELHQFIKTAMAKGPGKSGIVIDARISATR